MCYAILNIPIYRSSGALTKMALGLAINIMLRWSFYEMQVPAERNMYRKTTSICFI